MARSSWTQTNFLGGEWSVSAQGRLDLPDYKIALASCRNAYPQEEGSVVLRSGLHMCGPTQNGHFAVTVPWDIVQAAVYDLEISVVPGVGSQLRIWQGDQPVIDSTANITAISAGSPCQITLSAPVTWATNDIIYITFPVNGLSGTTVWAPILNRQLAVTKIDTTHFTLTDAVTGANISGAAFPALPSTPVAGKIFTLGLSYTQISQLFQICPVPVNNGGLQQMFLFAHGVTPVQITYTAPVGNGWPTFAVTTPYFQGPYETTNLNQTGNVSAASGTVTFTSTGSLPNNGAGFQTGDVNRPIRLLSQPPQFNAATTYNAGDAVMWHNVAYQSLVGGNVGNTPDQNPTKWVVEPTLIQWVDGTITARTNTTVVTVNLNGAILPTPNGLTIFTFRLGIYNASFMVWPSCGTFHEGRMWLGGAIANQFDASEVSNLTSFRPTDVNANVLATSAISYALLSTKNYPILWMTADQSGVLVGTQSEEWLIFATQTNFPITATNVQAHPQSRHGSFLMQPVHAGFSLIFMQRYAHTVMEYLVDVFAQRFGGLPLNEKAKQVTNFLSQLAYVENIFPVVWARNFGGGLVGCTYRRTSRFINQPPEFKAWHAHNIGGVAPFISSLGTSAILQPSVGGQIVDAVAVTTGTGVLTGTFYRQILMPPYDPGLGDQYAWHLDGSVSGLYTNSQFQPNIFVGLEAIEDGTNMYFLGAWYQPGTVSVYIAGIYFGDYPVVNGAVTVPYGSDPGGIGTRAFLATQLVSTGSFGTCNVQGLGQLPVCIGSKYTATVKLLRQDVPDEAHTPQGMAVGDTRRVYTASANIAVGYNNSITVGVDGRPSFPMVLRQYVNGPPLANNIPFISIWQDTVDDDVDYDGQITLSITGPYPFVLNNITPFTETEER